MRQQHRGELRQIHVAAATHTYNAIRLELRRGFGRFNGRRDRRLRLATAKSLSRNSGLIQRLNGAGRNAGRDQSLVSHDKCAAELTLLDERSKLLDTAAAKNELTG